MGKRTNKRENFRKLEFLTLSLSGIELTNTNRCDEGLNKLLTTEAHDKTSFPYT